MAYRVVTLVPTEIDGGTFRLRYPSGGVAPTYSDAAGSGASTAAQPANSTRYAVEGIYVLDVTLASSAVVSRILRLDHPTGSDDAAVGAPGTGLLAARPAAAYARFYYATDVAGGTLYVSDLTTWRPAQPVAAGQRIASIASTTSVALNPDAFADVAGVQMVIPAGIPHRIQVRWKPAFYQGSAAAGVMPAAQIRVVDAATVGNAAATMLCFDDAQHLFPTASTGGSVIAPYACAVGPDRTALGAAQTVKLQGLASSAAGLGPTAIDAGFTLAPLILEAVAL